MSAVDTAPKSEGKLARLARDAIVVLLPREGSVHETDVRDGKFFIKIHLCEVSAVVICTVGDGMEEARTGFEITGKCDEDSGVESKMVAITCEMSVKIRSVFTSSAAIDGSSKTSPRIPAGEGFFPSEYDVATFSAVAIGFVPSDDVADCSFLKVITL
jgi:hypothetical protein